MATKRNGGHRTIGVYRAYNFRDRDPAIDSLRNLAEEHFGRRLTGRELKAIFDGGGPSVGCMRAWWIEGTTMRPTNPALEAAGRSIRIRARLEAHEIEIGGISWPRCTTWQSRS